MLNTAAVEKEEMYLPVCHKDVCLHVPKQKFNQGHGVFNSQANNAFVRRLIYFLSRDKYFVLVRTSSFISQNMHHYHTSLSERDMKALFVYGL